MRDFHGGTGLNDFQIDYFGTEYSLDESESAPLIALYDLLKKGRTRYVEPLRVAIGRFNQSYNRRKAEDKLVDFVIALESSLLSGLSDELSYRLGLRGAILLAETEDPVYTAAFLQAVYEIRSKIVHEGRGLFELVSSLKKLKKIAPQIDIGQIPQICEDMVRKILKKYLALLSSGRQLSEINADLDNQILVRLKSA